MNEFPDFGKIRWKKRSAFFDLNRPPKTDGELVRDTLDLVYSEKRSFVYILKALSEWAYEKSRDIPGPWNEIQLWWTMYDYTQELSDNAKTLKHLITYYPEYGPGEEGRWPYPLPHTEPWLVQEYTKVMLDSSSHAFRKILEVLKGEAARASAYLVDTDFDPRRAGFAVQFVISQDMIHMSESWDLFSKQIELLLVPPVDKRTGLHVGPFIPPGRKEWRPE